jgi:antitoxin MazE
MLKPVWRSFIRLSVIGRWKSWLKQRTLTIQQWGNSVAVRIAAAVARSAHFEVGQEAEATTDEIGVTIKPVGPRKLTLAEKPARFDPAKHGDEALATGRVGAEVF